MSSTKIAVFAVLLLLAASASAATRNNQMRISILDSETHSESLGGNNVPVNCDQVNFDAYCNHSRDAIITNTLLVQEENGKTYHVVCTIETRYSRCVPLPKGASYDARREKHGVTVYYVDDRGKARSQLYTIVPEDRKAFAEINGEGPHPQTPVPIESGERAAMPQPNDSPQETVKCSFSSTPSGAEVLLDGRFVGSTPSVVGLSKGNHMVMVSKPGFAEWRRELEVSSGSDLTIHAELQTGK